MSSEFSPLYLGFDLSTQQLKGKNLTSYHFIKYTNYPSHCRQFRLEDHIPSKGRLRR